MPTENELAEEMARLLHEAETAIEHATWKAGFLDKVIDEARHQGDKNYFCSDRASGWRFVVIAFSIEDLGFPVGARGCIGSGMKAHTLLPLPCELAEKAVRLAEAQLKENP